MLSLSFNRSDGVMRTMNTEKLLKTISVIQTQMDVLLDFNVSARSDVWTQVTYSDGNNSVKSFSNH